MLELDYVADFNSGSVSHGSSQYVFADRKCENLKNKGFDLFFPLIFAKLLKNVDKVIINTVPSL